MHLLLKLEKMLPRRLAKRWKITLRKTRINIMNSEAAENHKEELMFGTSP
jgi:hypothetical protein